MEDTGTVALQDFSKTKGEGEPQAGGEDLEEGRIEGAEETTQKGKTMAQ